MISDFCWKISPGRASAEVMTWGTTWRTIRCNFSSVILRLAANANHENPPVVMGKSVNQSYHEKNNLNGYINHKPLKSSIHGASIESTKIAIAYRVAASLLSLSRWATRLVLRRCSGGFLGVPSWSPSFCQKKNENQWGEEILIFSDHHQFF